AFDRVFAAVFPRHAGSDHEADPDSEAQPDRESAPTERPKTREDKEPPRSAGEQDPREMSDGSSPQGEDDEEGEEVLIPVAQASDDELLGEKTFAELEPHELAALYRLMTRLKLATPQRRTRRARHRRRGERLDMRRTIRGSLRTAGDPIRLSHKRRDIVRRRLVMLCDISGSMEPYARAYLQFLLIAAGTGPNAEAFAFATRLTRLTRALGGRNPELAIERAAAAAPDWSSGTRIGEALKTFNDRHGRRGMARGAVIVILSDGWERGDPEVVSREMERLARLAYRIVWVNPRITARGFSPRAGGLVAALPHVDALVSGHSLNALEEVADAIGAKHSEDDLPGQARWKPPAPASAEEEEETWGFAGTTESPVAMPSGYGPSRGNTTS
ncbi:MAG: VWA domain-containing protein, partial [Actinobacteria bacterium]|nr:VWA domain-containing protein [Actinomycetota bacterium]